jgi:serine/threonine protein kinase
LARGGDLASLLAQKDRLSHFQEDEAFFLALSELSSAIAAVHDYTSDRLNLNLIGCHHDLKPQSILVDGNTFILADFGLSKFKKATESSKTQFKIGGGYYLAPECEDYEGNFEKHTISRPSDIWSFGCIITEVLTYMQKGVGGLAEFKSRREVKFTGFKTFTFHAGSRKPNDGVISWLLDLESQCNQSGYLLIQLARSMLSMEPKDRPKARQITSRLRFIVVDTYIRLVDEQYGKLSQAIGSFEADIEQKRFKSWACTFKSADSNDDPWNYTMDTQLDFKSAIRHLISIRDELLSVLSRCQEALSPFLLDLRLLNDKLLGLLPRKLQERAKTHLELCIVRTDDPELLEKMQMAFGSMSSHERIGMLAAIKHMHILVSERSEECRPDLRLDPEFVQSIEDFEEHSLATVKKPDEISERRVLVEWIKYGTHWEGPVSQEMIVRVEAIAELLNSPTKPDGFRVLHCSAFFHDPSRFGFGLVYEFPWSLSLRPQILNPRSLANIIDRTQNFRERPSLGDRFKVAYDLAVSVLEFHKVGWMHKSISAYNVVFFTVKGSKAVEWMETAYIIGFNHSRPNEPAAFTEGPATEPKSRKYHNPKYSKKGQRFRQEFDYYSLGIVLLEIGIWKILEDIISGWNISSSIDLQEKLLEKRVPHLNHSMGAGYRDAVNACLQGDFSSPINAEYIAP